MPPFASALVGIGFFLSELSLAVWRRATAKTGSQERDAGSLRLLWIVNLLAIGSGVTLAALGVGPRLPGGIPWEAAGLGVFFLGTALRWWAIRHLGRFFTVNVTVADDHRVIDTGPYRLVRHPSYSGLLLQFAGLGLTLGVLPSFLVVLILPTLAILYRIRVEEAALRAGLPAYAAYMGRTKKIVPLLF